MIWEKIFRDLGNYPNFLRLHFQRFALIIEQYSGRMLLREAGGL